MIVHYQMKLIPVFCLLILSRLFSFAQEFKTHPKMDYHFSWDGSSSFLKVDLFYPAAKDTTSFIYGSPEIGNQVNIFNVVKNIQTGKGDSVSIDSAKRKIMVWHKTAGPKMLHYEINGALISAVKHNNANEQFRPQLIPGSFCSLSFNLFMQVDTGRYKEISYVWDKWPAGMGYFSSADPESTPDKNVIVKTDQLSWVYMAMDKQLQIKKYHVNHAPYYAISSARDTINKIQDCLKPFLSIFFPAITDYFKDDGHEHYFVSALPFLNHAKPNYTGVGLVDGFSMRYSGPFNLDYKTLIAHETTHKWIGNKLKIKQKGMEYMWFEEGFDDYTQICILAETAMITPQQFLDHVNSQNLSPHYKSPVRTAPADSIEKHFWVEHDYEVLPYQRGFIYAFYFDNQIRLASAGKKTIRDFFLALLKRVSSNRHGEMTIDDYVETASLFLPKAQIKDEIEKYMQNGVLLDFHSTKLIDGFQINYQDDIPVLALSPGSDLLRMLSWK
jgi:hypothetical protein